MFEDELMINESRFGVTLARKLGIQGQVHPSLTSFHSITVEDFNACCFESTSLHESYIKYVCMIRYDGEFRLVYVLQLKRLYEA